jgi:gliding motility-associated-like protein
MLTGLRVNAHLVGFTWPRPAGSYCLSMRWVLPRQLKLLAGCYSSPFFCILSSLSMLATLLRRLGLGPGLVLFLLGLGAAHPALATHLLGGEMTYRYLDANGPATAPLRYEIIVAIYNNCGNGAIRPSASVGIYNQDTGTRVILTSTNYAFTSTNSAQTGMMSIPQTSLSACVQPAIPPGCTISGVSQPYQLQKFVGIVNLPRSTAGFYALFTDGNRNVDITNLYNAGGQALTLYTALAPPALPNRSPVFSDLAVAIICANDTTYLLNNAVDADGDRLVYSFGQPYGTVDGLGILPLFSFAPPPPILSYTTGFGYSAATPFGTTAGNFAELDASTGIAKYSSTRVGAKYAVAVDVSEYRTVNGQEVLIGTTRRDLQLVVASCPTTKSPVLPPVTVMPRNYTIEAGSSLRVPITVTQADGHPLSMTLNSVLLDGAGGYDASLNGQAGTVTPGNPTGTATITGTNGVVTGTLSLTTSCTDARTTPYDVALLVKDTGCAGKTVVDVLHITVTKPKGPTAITGDATVCGLNTVHTYTASGGTSPKLSWRVVGGTVVSTTATTVQVNWSSTGTGTVVARGVTQYGCLTDSVTQRVAVAQAGTLTAAGTLAICRGGSTTLNITGGAAPYTITGGATPITGNGPFVVSPTQTTTYTITGAAVNSTCGATGQVTVTVNPLPVADVGTATRSTCAGVPIILGGTAVAGTTYSWSPATGLNNPTSANPTATLTNTMAAPITQRYTLTATNPATGCQATNTVEVLVNPLPVAVPGAAVTLCSGSATTQLGAAPVAGLTYIWSPTTGLSSATSANPTVTLTNTTGAPVTQTYTLTTTSAAGCTSTGTVAVTLNPLPLAVPGAAATLCSGSSAQLGAAPVAGLTYSWNPTTGLSSATSANPTVTLTNTTGAATTQTYTLTVTNPATGCVSTGTVAVAVNPLPIATPGVAATFCSGSSAQLGVPPALGTTYSWSPSTGLSSVTSANPTVTLTNTTGAPITQTYTLTATNAGNCKSTATVTVTVNPLPVATPGAAVTLCSGSSAQLGAAPVAGLTYSWSPTTGLSSATSANPTVTLTNTTGAPNTQTYTLTTTSAAGCSSTGTVAVTLNPLPVAVPGAAATLCSGGATQLGAAPVAGLTYSWSPATGLSSATSANPTVTLTNTTGAPITQTYTLTTTNAAGCSSTGTVAVTVRPVVAPGTIGADQTVCLGSAPAPLTSTAAASGGTGTFGYQWQVSADNANWTIVAGATSPTYSPGPITTIRYYRRVATDACGTATSNVVTVRTQAPLVASVTLPTPAAQCAGTAMTFTPVPTNGGTAPTYRWFVNNTLVASSTTFTSSTLANGDLVRVELTPATGFCAGGDAAATATVSLIPIALPTAAISVQTPLPACSGSPVTFRVDNVTNLGTGTQYQWQVDGVAVGGAQTASSGNTFTSNTLRDGQLVTLALRTTTACGPVTVVSNAIPVAITPTPNVEAGPDKTIMEGDHVTLEGTADGTYPVTWAPALGLTFDGDQLRPVAAPTVTTTYTLSAQVGNCSDQSSVTVTVTPRLRIPNALSPNGDGDDDTWEIDNIGDYPSNHVLVFNRWGSKIFETSGYRRGNEWNGSISGQPAPVGTYYYVITLGNGKSYSGPLTVVY